MLPLLLSGTATLSLLAPTAQRSSPPLSPCTQCVLLTAPAQRVTFCCRATAVLQPRARSQPPSLSRHGALAALSHSSFASPPSHARSGPVGRTPPRTQRSPAGAPAPSPAGRAVWARSLPLRLSLAAAHPGTPRADSRRGCGARSARRLRPSPSAGPWRPGSVAARARRCAERGPAQGLPPAARPQPGGAERPRPRPSGPGPAARWEAARFWPWGRRRVWHARAEPGLLPAVGGPGHGLSSCVRAVPRV